MERNVATVTDSYAVPSSDAEAPASAPHSRVAPTQQTRLEKVASYAEFHGAQGRDVFFRPDRYQLCDLGPVGVAVELFFSDQVYLCELSDVSQNGVAFAWPANVAIEVGAMLGEIVVKFDEHEAYRGEARVSSVRREDGKTIVGASFIDTLMNIEDVLHLRDVKAWAFGVGAKGIGLREARWRVPGQERFKAAVAEFRLFLEDAQTKLGELEAVLPWSVAHGDQDSPARDALIQRIRRELMADGLELAGEIDAALRLAPRSSADALREYSIRHLDPLLMQSPWMHRARHKPLGYAGDYEVMNGLYGNHFSGPTLFAKAVNLCFVWSPAAVAVRARKDMIKGRLDALLDSPRRAGPVRILSIAAGPAQEIFELLNERESLPGPVEIVLFDQDKRALSFSYGRLKRSVSMKWKDQVTLVHLNDSIKRLLRDSTVFSGHGEFDAVYSCGLFDYLQLPTAVSLCTSLYSLLAPGGTLYVGNMVPSCQSRWVMEHHLDWFLVYRERSEMLELAKAAAATAHAQIVEETTGINPFVALTRE